jgi:hypothetical protein
MDLLINRSLNFMPSRFRTRLAYEKFVIINNATFSFANVRFIPTGAYDIDPVVGSSAMPGFSELGSMYRFYRTTGFHVTASYSNLDTNAAICYLCPQNVDPGANESTSQSLLSNRRSIQKMIGPSTGNGVAQNLACSVSIEEYGGVKWTGQLDGYSAAVSSNPTNNIYIVPGVLTTNAMVNGVACSIKITIEIEFFELSTTGT